MRITDFVINLFTRFAPVSQAELANLKIQLGDWYVSQINTYKLKMETTEKVTKQLIEKEEELKKLDPHTPDYEKKMFEIEEIEDQLQNPTLLEKCIDFLDKPIVRVALMAIFSLLSWWIMRKLTGKKEEPEIEEEEQQQPQFQQSPYQGQPQYNPWGYVYNPYQPGPFPPQSKKFK